MKNKDNNINYLLSEAGKQTGWQQVRIVETVDGVDCFEKCDDPNMITIAGTYDTEEMKKRIDEEQNEQHKNYLRCSLDKALRLKDEWEIKNMSN